MKSTTDQLNELNKDLLSAQKGMEDTAPQLPVAESQLKRLIGIISHVQDLEEKIDRQIVVSKTLRGSVISIVNGD